MVSAKLVKIMGRLKKVEKHRLCNHNHGCIFLKIREPGGNGRLRINLRKVKDLVNNASILAIFSLRLSNCLQRFH